MTISIACAIFVFQNEAIASGQCPCCRNIKLAHQIVDINVLSIAPAAAIAGPIGSIMISLLNARCISLRICIRTRVVVIGLVIQAVAISALMVSLPLMR
ncbi:hypothetical protein GCM10009096_21390 [Parasphingorhabdus litoris]|uniref:Uncharacterized protein n=1 Tax=Parasphingorhabdus litoris TaxID=394733 RepID=A0ABN1AL13_9SPHN